jgi:hypothetical protein
VLIGTLLLSPSIEAYAYITGTARVHDTAAFFFIVSLCVSLVSYRRAARTTTRAAAKTIALSLLACASFAHRRARRLRLASRAS